MATPFINEIHYDNVGTDTGEFIEIAGLAGMDLTGYSLVLYNGTSPSAAITYTTRALSGVIANQGNGFGTLSFAFPTDGIQNGGNDAIALVGPDGVIQFLSYEGVTTASNGPAAGMTSTDIGVAETTTTPVGASLALTGTGSQYGDFTWAIDSNDTPNAINTGQTFVGASGASVSIGDVTITEGDAGTQIATFTITRSNADTAFTIDFATTDDTATAGNDFESAAGTLTFAANGALTQTVSVTINGDVALEPTERFTVDLTNLVQTTGSTSVADAQGVGTIVSDDVSLSFIHDVQGASFFSAFVAAEGITAYNQATISEVTVRGVVTAIDTSGTLQGFYISEEESDWDMSAFTSEGIFVRTTSATAGLTVGETVTVTAKVMEFQDFTNLPRTMLTTPSAIVQGNDLVALPTFIIDGTAGHKIPTSIISDDSPDFKDSDGSSGTFDPQNDALDFYETIEGMRVTFTNAIVGDGFVSGGDDAVRFNAYSADNADQSLINSRGGYTISGDPAFYPVDTIDPNDDVIYGGATVNDGAQHGDILELDFSNVGRGGTAGFDQDLTMGDSLGNVSGILDFDFNVVKLFVTDALDADKIAALDDTTPIQEITALVGDDRALRIASFNVENLSPVGTTFSTNNGVEITTQAKYDKLAANIANNLQAPDIIMIEEVQDNNGVGSGSSDASTTWDQLVTAVNAATGKTYQWVDEVVTGNVGGAPGGNIRVGFLYDTARVQLGDLAADATLAERRQYTDRIGDGTRDAGDLIAIDDSQVAGINPADWDGTRRSLVGEFTFNGQTVYAIANHLPSKGGSGNLYQINQDNDAGQPANGGWDDRNALAQDLWSVQNLISTTQNDAKLVAGGDYNEFWFNRPLEVLTGYANPDGTANTSGTNYVNLVVQELDAAERFSYDFNGRSQTLDTIIADQALAGVSSYDVVHINTGYNERTGGINPASSDHDPAIASFDFRDFDETLSSAAGVGLLEGFGGNDTLISGAGDDMLDGGAGDSDTADYREATAGIIASLAITVSQDTGGAGFDRFMRIENLTGSAFDDELGGDDADNRLLGGAGNDGLTGGAGADRLNGGNGIDTARYETATAAVVASLIDSSVNSGDAFGDTYSEIEQLSGSSFDDTLTGDDNANALSGKGGADRLFGLGGDDTLRIDATPMLVDGGSGKDTLRLTEGGTATIVDGIVSGVERFVVGDGATLDLSAITNDLGGVIRADSTVGGGATIVGTQGNDTIAAGSGADDLGGGMGNDRFTVSTDAATIRGGADTDTLVIDGSAAATLVFTDANLKLVEAVVVKNDGSVDFSGYGNALSITVGGNGASVVGSAADDRIAGSIGDDVIAGSAGADVLTGRGGADVFVFTTLEDMSAGGARDRIGDFSGDTIDLSTIDADPVMDGMQSFTFIGDAAFTGASGDDFEVRVKIRDNGISVVQFDINHDGIADAAFTVSSPVPLQATDFIL